MQSREEGKKYGQWQVQLIEHFIEHWESSRKVHFPFFIFPCLMKIHLLWLHRKRRNKRELSFLFLLSSSSKHLSLPGLEAKRGELVERDRREQRYPPPTPLTRVRTRLNRDVHLQPLKRIRTRLSLAAQFSFYSGFWRKRRFLSIPRAPPVWGFTFHLSSGCPAPLSLGCLYPDELKSVLDQLWWNAVLGSNTAYTPLMIKINRWEEWSPSIKC